MCKLSWRAAACSIPHLQNGMDELASIIKIKFNLLKINELLDISDI